MRLFLTPNDRAIAELWRRSSPQVLRDDSECRCHISGGVIVVPCADGHHLVDTCTHQAQLMEGEVCLVHTVSLNGGPLLLSRGTPLLTVGQDDDAVLIRHIRMASEMKEVKTVVLHAHAPCGAARAHGLLNMVTVTDALLRAQDRLMEEFPDFVIIPMMQVDWAEKGNPPNDRSYLVDRDAFVQFTASL